MGNFRPSGNGGYRGKSSMNRFGGGQRRSFGGSRGGFGGRDSVRAEMHDALCGKCGKECKVPFKPKGDKPVFCSDCFSKGGSQRDSFRSGNERPSQSGISAEQFKQINAKLDKILSVLEMLEIADDDDHEVFVEDDEEDNEEDLEDESEDEEDEDDSEDEEDSKIA